MGVFGCDLHILVEQFAGLSSVPGIQNQSDALIVPE
jgi:hypothetical protein